MESQPQNPELWVNPENFHPCFYVLMDSSFWFATIKLGCSTVNRGVTVYNFQIKLYFVSPKIVLVLANSVVSDEMQPYAR